MRCALLFLLLLVGAVTGDVLSEWINALDLDAVPQPNVHFPIGTTTTIEPEVHNITETEREGYCSWDETKDRCVPNQQIQLLLVELSDSELAKVYAPFLRMKVQRANPKGKKGRHATRCRGVFNACQRSALSL